MALATRCPHCLTTFRVANDQLKLHAGLVRCGACQQTFNGVEHLLPATAVAAAPSIPAVETAPLAGGATSTSAEVPANSLEATPPDLEQTTPAASTSLDFDLGLDDFEAITPDVTDDIAASRVELETRAALLDESAADWSQADTGAAEEIRVEPVLAEIGSAEAERVSHESIQSDAEAQAPADGGSEHLHEPYLAAAGAGLADAGSDEPSLSEAEVDESEPAGDDSPPDFVIQAEQKQKRGRIRRLAMLTLSAVLLPALLAQTVFSLRSQIAAGFPQTRPALAQVCQALHCQLPLPAQIDQISIEASELQALAPDRNVFLLMLQLQNHSATLQAWPMVELVLNDTRDKAVLQRSFTPVEYLPNKSEAAKGFASGSEQNIKLYFELPKLKAAGYHVNVFYP